MEKFKCGDIDLELEEIGYTPTNRMKIKFCVKYQDKILIEGEDLESGCNMYRGIKDMGNQLIDFLICGDFLNEKDRLLVENNVDYDEELTDDQETVYLLEEIYV